MTNLFKLKKDGKCVGYLKITETVLFKLAPAENWGNAWLIWEKGDIDFDEALPYVCDDRNGDKVFAGDETNLGAIAWNTKLLAWTLLENLTDVLGENAKVGVTHLLSDYKAGIELIKEQDND